MKRLLAFTLVLLALAYSAPARQTEGESVLLIGGPSLYQWEKYKAYPHDHWWANFIRAARIRTEQLRGQFGPNARITWLVYKQGYLDRAPQEHQDLLALIDSVREKFNINLVYFDKGGEVINYLNNGQPRGRVKIVDFEYFGHSNKACFMFDYSSHLDSAAKSWLHENELIGIHRNIFARDAYIKSWGCHTGESMSMKWQRATGTNMIGAIGKTQFMMEELPILTSQNGRWVK